jgi:hypothetical protein
MSLRDGRDQVYNPLTGRWENHSDGSKWAKRQREKEQRQKTRIWLETEEGQKWKQDKKDRGEWRGRNLSGEKAPGAAFAEIIKELLDAMGF